MKNILILIALMTSTGTRVQAQKQVYADADFIKTVLDAQNAYRIELNLPPLTWSAKLAEDALAWAKELARGNKGHHDPRDRELREGENIWWGDADKFTYVQMVDLWGLEKKDFVYGVFPHCSSSSSAVVGHYTQMIWKNTTETGCAIAGNGQTDFLVCRYSPPGNVISQKPY